MLSNFKNLFNLNPKELNIKDIFVQAFKLLKQHQLKKRWHDVVVNIFRNLKKF